MSSTIAPKQKAKTVVKMRDVVEFYIGGGWGKEDQSNEFSEPALVIRGTDIPKVTHGDPSSCPLRFHKTSNLRSRRLETGDIVIEVSGGSKDQPVGRTVQIKDSLLSGFVEPVICASFCKLIRPDSDAIDSGYLYYHLQWLYQSRAINQFQTQSTGISNFHFETFLDQHQLSLPGLNVQRRIASILSAYDDLIENNRRRIEILEEMARNIYREWFVHFRFPGHEDVQMVDSPLGPIPEGWEVKRLRDIASLHRKSISPLKDPLRDFVHYSLPAFDDGQLPGIESGESIRSNKYVMPEQCVLLSKLNPRIPRVWLVLNTPFERSIASTEFMVLTPEEPASIEFLFSHCRSEEFMGTLASVAGGTSTSHQRVKPDNVLATEISVPDSRVMQAFTECTAPLVKLASQLQERNSLLSRTRDLLLPKLVAGEIALTELSESTAGYEHD